MMYIIGINITFFLVLLLLTKKNKSEADKILAIWLLFTGVHLILFYSHISGKYMNFPYLLGLEVPFPLVHAPFLYLYTESLTKDSKNNLKILHFLPFVCSYFILFNFLKSSLSHKIYIYTHDGLGYENLMTFFLYFIIIHGVVYIVLSYLKLKTHRQVILDKFSNTEEINLNWLRYLIIGTSIIWASILLGNDKILFSIVVGYVIFIGYFGINQLGIFTQKETMNSVEILISNSIYNDYTEATPSLVKGNTKKIETEGDIAINKYQKSTLSELQAKKIHSHLTQLMNVEKIFLNPELTLSELSEKLDTPPNHLSQVINSYERKNFFDYINLYRIVEFKKCVHLPENKKFTFLALAFKCGFNSKTSFNRNFKKVTGLSPSEYIRLENIQ